MPRKNLPKKLPKPRVVGAIELPGSPRSKLREGLAKVIQANEGGDPDAVRQLVAEGWPTSVDKFLRWVSVGNDQLYVKHADLKDDVVHAVGQFKKLSSTTKRPTRRTSELQAANKRVAYLDRMVQGLTKDLLELSMERDTLRMAHAFQRARADLYEAELMHRGIPLPQPEVGLRVVTGAVSFSKTNGRPRDRLKN